MKDSEASSTAFTVLQGILYISGNHSFSSLISEEHVQACKQILNSSPEGRKRLKQLSSPLYRFMVPLMERCMMPGITLHYPLRKKYIEEMALQAIDEGYTQLINIGAGFDTLFWRLHQKHPEIQFIELDHPASSAVKSEAVSQRGSNFKMAPVDLSITPLQEALNALVEFNPQAKTFYICEGVLMYLPLEAVKNLFKSINLMTGKGSRLAFTAVAPLSSSESNSTFALKLYLKIKSEPLVWNMERQELSKFVGSLDYKLLDDADDQDLIKKYLPSHTKLPTLHKGEFLAVAEKL